MKMWVINKSGGEGGLKPWVLRMARFAVGFALILYITHGFQFLQVKVYEVRRSI
jgi:hypothetical protein